MEKVKEEGRGKGEGYKEGTPNLKHHNDHHQKRQKLSLKGGESGKV